MKASRSPRFHASSCGFQTALTSVTGSAARVCGVVHAAPMNNNTTAVKTLMCEISGRGMVQEKGTKKINLFVPFVIARSAFVVFRPAKVVPDYFASGLGRTWSFTTFGRC